MLPEVFLVPTPNDQEIKSEPNYNEYSDAYIEHYASHLVISPNVEREQRLKGVPSLHGPYVKPLSSRRLLHAFCYVKYAKKNIKLYTIFLPVDFF